MTFSSRLPILLLFISSLFSASLFAQNAFQKLYGEAGSTIGNDLLVLPNGDYLVGGAQVSEVLGSPAHPTLYRLAPDGSVGWQRPLDTAAKVEGVAIDGDSVWLVSDADDRAVPAQLLHATLP